MHLQQLCALGAESGRDQLPRKSTDPITTRLRGSGAAFPIGLGKPRLWGLILFFISWYSVVENRPFQRIAEMCRACGAPPISPSVAALKDKTTTINSDGGSISPLISLPGCMRCRGLVRLDEPKARQELGQVFLRVAVAHATGVCEKTLLQRIRHLGILAFETPNQGPESSFCCWGSGQRLT